MKVALMFVLVSSHSKLILQNIALGGVLPPGTAAKAVQNFCDRFGWPSRFANTRDNLVRPFQLQPANREVDRIVFS